MGIKLDDLLEVRIAIEMLNVEWAILRGGARLAELSDVVAHEQDDGVPQRRFDLHRTINELSGNRASKLLSNVHTKLLARFTAQPVEEADYSDEERAAFGAKMHQEHEEVVSAMLAGDVGLSRHRLRRHLEHVGEALSALDSESSESD